jgi:hypothetical protein
VQTPEEIRFR